MSIPIPFQVNEARQEGQFCGQILGIDSAGAHDERRDRASRAAAAVALSRSGSFCRKRPQAKNSSRSFSAHFTPPKAAAEDDDAFGAHPWKGKQLTSIGKLITTDELPVRCVLRRKRLIFNNSMSSAKTGTCEAGGAGRRRTQ